MSNSWWKKLFNFENDEWLNEDGDREPPKKNTASSYRAPVGRLEDADRHIEVRMVKQYPEKALHERYTPRFEKIKKTGSQVSSFTPEKKEASEQKKDKVWADKTHDSDFTPAYEKAGRRRPEPEATYNNETHSILNEGRMHAAAALEQKKEPLIKKKKTPFRRTEVPSPVYGFRPRPNVIQKASDSLSIEDELRNRSSIRQEEPAQRAEIKEERSDPEKPGGSVSPGSNPNSNQNSLEHKSVEDRQTLNNSEVTPFEGTKDQKPAKQEDPFDSNSNSAEPEHIQNNEEKITEIKQNLEEIDVSTNEITLAPDYLPEMGKAESGSELADDVEPEERVEESRRRSVLPL